MMETVNLDREWLKAKELEKSMGDYLALRYLQRQIDYWLNANSEHSRSESLEFWKDVQTIYIHIPKIESNMFAPTDDSYKYANNKYFV